MLIISLGSSIIYTGVWPYINMLDPTVRLDEYGFIVASDAFAQMVFSPVFGLICDRMKSVRSVSLFCCFLFMSGNVLYAIIGVFDREYGDWRKVRMWVMIAARLVVGSGTAIVSTSRYYVSSATLLSERTTHIALLSLFQTLGFLGGPLLQVLLALIGREPALEKEGKFFVDMYSAAGWLSATTGLLCFLLYLPGIFQDKFIAAKEIESMRNNQSEEKEKKILVKQMATISSASISSAGISSATISSASISSASLDLEEKLNAKTKDLSSNQLEYPSILLTVTATYSFFAFLFNFVLLETIVTPLAMDQWGWSQKEAIMNIGYMMSASGAISLVSFGAIGPLSKRLDERMLLLLAGLVPMIIGRVVMFPFPGAGMPPMRQTNACLEGVWNPINQTCSINGTIVHTIHPQSMDHFHANGTTVHTIHPQSMDNLHANVTTVNTIHQQSMDQLHDNDSTVNTIQPQFLDQFLMGVPMDFISKSVADSVYSSYKAAEMDLDAPMSGAPGNSTRGCAYEWCMYIPKVTVAQFMVGFVVTTTGYTFCVTIMGSLYSKSLGSIPQGFWMSLLTVSGSLARVLGPIFFTIIYENYGTYLTFSLVTGSLVLSGILILIAYKQLGNVPQGGASTEPTPETPEGKPTAAPIPTPDSVVISQPPPETPITTSSPIVNSQTPPSLKKQSRKHSQFSVQNLL